MSKTSTYRVPFRRRLEGKTNYAKRLAFVKSGMPRAVIRKTTNHLQVQFIKTEKGKDFVLASAHTQELEKFSYTGHTGNIPAAYLTGYLAGKRFSIQKAREAIVDIGVQRKVLGSRLFATVKGIKDAGINIRVDAQSFPKEERIKGKHIEAFFQNNPSKMNAVQFSSYIEKKVDVSQFSGMVESCKKNIEMSVKT